jgi:uncharacterized damage-inducible protein DinB
MGSTKREILVVDAGLSKEPEIGRWLWALQDCRDRTMRVLDGLAPAMIDWQPPDNGSSIGTILFHMAAIEADWLYVEALEQPFPPQVIALFPYEVRDKQGRLTQVTGVSMDEHLQRLETVRTLLLDAFGQMELSEFRRVRSLEYYDVTPEWVLHHMMQHEAEHRGQIGTIRALAEDHFTL